MCKDASEAFLFLTTQTQARILLGMCHVYRLFVQDFAKITGPLSDLLKKGMPADLTADGVTESLVVSQRPFDTTAVGILERDDEERTAPFFGLLMSPAADSGEQGSSLGVSVTASVALSPLNLSESLARLLMTTLAGSKRTASPTAGRNWKLRSKWPQQTQSRMSVR